MQRYLADTGDDGYVYLRVAGVPQGVEPARPRSDVSHIGQHDDSSEDGRCSEHDGRKEEEVQLPLCETRRQRLHEAQHHVRLDERERAQCCDVLTRTNRLEP